MPERAREVQPERAPSCQVFYNVGQSAQVAVGPDASEPNLLVMIRLKRRLEISSSTVAFWRRRSMIHEFAYIGRTSAYLLRLSEFGGVGHFVSFPACIS